MAVIDSQVHVYEADTPRLPWYAKPNSNWCLHATADEMVAAMDQLGIDGAILVSPLKLYRYDSSYAEAAQRAYPGRFALIKPLNPTAPDVDDNVAGWKTTPGAVALRVYMKEQQDDGFAAGFLRAAQVAARHEMPLNLSCAGNLALATALIDRCTQTRFIIDHLGIVQPAYSPAAADAWADLPQVLQLARRDNVVIKVSGACTLSHTSYPYADIWSPLARIFDAFGLERCLWGSDWTRTFKLVDYEQATRPFLQTDRLGDDDRAMLMGGACARAYGWTPTTV